MLYNAYSQKVSGHSKSRKDLTSYMNIMVVGATGSGKTAFIRTLCESLKHDIIQGSFKESKPMVLKEPLRPTDELYSVTMQIEENGQRTALTLIDTPGITSGYTVEYQLRFLAKYIDYQFERTLAEESKLKRDTKASDTHVHSCLYFLDSKGLSGLTEVDKYLLRMLSSRVNIIPVIGKADTLSLAQREQFKSVFRKEVFDNLKIPIYGHIGVEEDSEDSPETIKQRTNSQQMNLMLDILQEYVDEDSDEDAVAMVDYLNHIPFSVIAYEEDPETGRPINAANPTPTALNIPKIETSNDIVTSPVIGSNMTAPKSLRDRRMAGNNKSVLGRRFPWATVECFNPIHCDFLSLKNTLLTSHRDMLRIDTFERFYEQYRTERLMSHKATKMINFGSKQDVAANRTPIRN